LCCLDERTKLVVCERDGRRKEKVFGWKGEAYQGRVKGSASTLDPEKPKIRGGGSA